MHIHTQYTHIYLHTYTPIGKYTYTYIHIRIPTRLYTNIHRYIHTYIQTYRHRIRHTRILTYVGIHMCTRAHDYAHVYAIAKMQLKFSTHMWKSMLYSPSLSHMHVLFCNITLKDLPSSYN